MSFQDRSMMAGRTWNNRGGMMGDRLVYISLIAPAINKTQPIIRSEIVDADDPGQDLRSVNKPEDFWHLKTTHSLSR
jgi:hypothetical protein